MNNTTTVDPTILDPTIVEPATIDSMTRDRSIIEATAVDTTSTSAPARTESATERRTGRLVDVVKSEWIKFRSVRSTKFTLAGAAVAMVAFGMIFSATAGSGDAAPGPAAAFSDPVQLALGAVNLTAMVVGVLGVLLIAGEYSTGLIRTTIAAVGNRLTVLRAKATVLGGVTAAVMGVASVLALWLGQAVYSGGQATMALTDPDTIGIVLGTTAYVTGIALIGLALGAILRSTASAIGVLVGGIFIGPPLLGLLPDWFSDNVLKYLPSEAGSAMMATVSDPSLLSTGAAYAVFAAWVLGLLGLAGILMRTRDA